MTIAKLKGTDDMYVKPYRPGDKKEKPETFAERLKALSVKKSTRVILFALAGALLLAAVLVFVIQWNEGEAAARKAQELLAQSGIEPAAASASAAQSDPFPAASDTYVQPEGPDAQGDDEIAGILETELEGYSVIARLDIEKLDLHLPVLSQTSSKALKVSVCYYEGSQPGEDGNIVITGHNYRSGAHFGKLDQMKEGDSVSLTDVSGDTYYYTVYKTELIKPDNPEALDNTSYARELTLLTCEANGNRRLVVRCCPANSNE